MKKIISKFGKVFYLLRKGIYFAWYRHHFLIPPKALKKYFKSFIIALKRGNNASNLFLNQNAYNKWFDSQEKVIIEDLKYNPLFSFVIPTYNVSKELLSECLDSILNQSYQNFEICIADDHSSSEETIETLKEYEKKDKRIKVFYRKENGMISESSNSAVKLANGDYLVLVDNDDTIEPDALYCFAKVLNEDKTLDFIYSDEDKLDFNGRKMEPHFKPDYSPDTLFGVNYICHLTCIRKSIFDKVGGFRKKYDGAQDYDLFLRIMEETQNVYHISKVLYHWRQSRTSTAGGMGNKSYAYLAGKNAIEDALKRRKIEADVLDNPKVSTYLVKYKHNNPLISIIIPIKDKAKITKKCLESLYKVNSYKNFEVILVDNNSSELETFEMFEYYKKYDNFHVLRLECEFNYSYINNEAVKIAKGDYVLFLNNDTEVIQKDMLDWMVGYASQKHVGCVGIKLLYDDEKVQHAGVVLGLGGLASHVFCTISRDDPGIFGRLCMPYNYSAVTAACLMIKKMKFEEIGGFDENLKVALNDVDLNLKVLDKGYYNVCLSNVEMFHYESKSRGYEVTEEKVQRFKKEENYLSQKWKTKYDFKEDKYFSKNYF